MVLVKIKGHEFNSIAIRDSSSRKALQFKNKIITILKKIGVPEDDIIIELERIAIRNVPAIVKWYSEGYYLHYSYNGCTKYVENLYVALKVIELKIEDLVNNEITFEEFLHEFSEDDDIEEKRAEARKTLGLDEDERDMEVINKAYKKLAKTHHPDMSSGDHELFQKINVAHKILKRELS